MDTIAWVALAGMFVLLWLLSRLPGAERRLPGVRGSDGQPWVRTVVPTRDPKDSD